MRRATLVALIGLASCSSPVADAPAVCTCVPAPASTRTSTTLLELVRRHQRAVRDGHRNGRDTKLVDDELRLQSAILCEPCGAWIGERATAEEIYPLDRADDAVGVVCTGLQLRDGTIAYGAAHPLACRTDPRSSSR